MSAPSFSLPPCPLCSSRLMLERPAWHYASNTSARRKVKCYFFTGCKHAAEVSPPATLHDGGFAELEARWAAKAQQLFTQQTAQWKDHEREVWRAKLADSAFLPGTTATLNFTPPASG